MPNWVKTRVSFSGDSEKISAIRNLLYTETVDKKTGKKDIEEFDFNKVIPMPKSLMIESSSSGDDGMRYLYLKSGNPFSMTESDLDFVRKFEAQDDKQKNKALKLGAKYMRNVAMYGFRNWYEWSCSYYDRYKNKNGGWRTKWNSCDVEWFTDSVVDLPNDVEGEKKIRTTTATVKFSTAWSFCEPVIRELGRKFPDVRIDFAYADEDAGNNSGYGYVEGDDFCIDYPDECSDEAYELFKDLWGYGDDELYKNEDGEWVWAD